MVREVALVILVSLLTTGLAHDETCTILGLFASNPASSCNEIYQHNIASRQNNAWTLLDKYDYMK